MKLVVLVPTRNEHRNIERFCRAYSEADKILVADTLSEDDTVGLAQGFPNAEVRPFTDTEYFSNGTFRTKQNEVYNFLTDWANEEGADWAIIENCDRFPNRKLRESYRQILERAPETVEIARCVQLFLWHEADGTYFPAMSSPTSGYGKADAMESFEPSMFIGQHSSPLVPCPGGWVPTFYAWRLSTGLRWDESIPYHEAIIDPFRPRTYLDVVPPYCRLHISWPTEEEVERKMAYYMAHPREKFGAPAHPLRFCGPLAPLPEWAHE